LIGQESPPDFAASTPTYRKVTTMLSRTDAPSLQVDIAGDRAIVHIPVREFGTVDGVPTDESLLAHIEEVQQTQLSLDFGQVRFVSSLGLAMLLQLNKRLTARGRRLALVNLQPHVYEVFSVTHLNTVLDVRQQEAA